MLTYTDLRTVQHPRPTALTIGNFDGIHRGHQTLLRELKQIAASLDADAGMLTFDPHPLTVLRPEQALSLLTTPQERLRLAARLDLDVGVIQPFTRELAANRPPNFSACSRRTSTWSRWSSARTLRWDATGRAIWTCWPTWAAS